MYLLNNTSTSSDLDAITLAALAFESQEGMLITDKHGIIIRVNKAFTRITGYTSDEVVGHSPSILRSGRHNNSFYKHMWETINTVNFFQSEIYNRKRDGSIYTELISISAIRDKEGNISNYFASFSDITKYREAIEQVYKLAYFDPLTGLANRRLLNDRVTLALTRGGRNNSNFALLILDLDYFKTVNDSFGHLAGDELLQQVAVRLLNSVRDTDLVARLGGDEFVVLIEDIETPTDINIIATKIITNISTPYNIIKCNNVTMGVSIGISLYPEHGNTASDLMDRADNALYKSKDNRGCYTIYYS